MATPKPQIRSLFATPVCQHFHPIAAEANAELRPIIVEKAQSDGNVVPGQGWRSAPDFESWAGAHAEHLLRVVRELADSVTATRTGKRTSIDWKIATVAAVRPTKQSLRLIQSMRRRRGVDGNWVCS